MCATTHRSTAPVVRNRPGWSRARELPGARSLGGPAGTRTMVVDQPSRRSAVFAPCTPCRRARVRRHRSTPGLVPSFHSEGWGVRTAEVRYQTRRCWSETLHGPTAHAVLAYDNRQYTPRHNRAQFGLHAEWDTVPTQDTTPPSTQLTGTGFEMICAGICPVCCALIPT